MRSEPTPLYLVFDGAALEGLLYRIVRRCPPTLDDFRSYEALGQQYDRKDYFKGAGVSMHTTSKRAMEIARYFRRGNAIATVDLRGTAVVWAQTARRGHVTVWAPPELLLRCVVQCDEHE